MASGRAPFSDMSEHGSTRRLVQLADTSTFGKIAGEKHQQLITEYFFQRSYLSQIMAQREGDGSGLADNKPALRHLVEMEHALNCPQFALDLLFDAFHLRCLS